MSVPFSRTASALREDRSRAVLVAVVAIVLLLAGVVAWAVLGRLPVTAMSIEARLETAERVHVVNAPLAGRIVEVKVHLGDQVAAGQVLARLDDEQPRLALEVQRARLASLDERLPLLAQQLDSEKLALAQTKEAATASQGELAALSHSASERERLAREEAQRTRDLAQAGISSKAELEQAQSLKRSTAAERRAARLEAAKARAEGARDATSAARRVEDAEHRIAEARGERAVVAAEIDRLGAEVERAVIRAPVAGRVGASRELTVGTVVAEGEELLRVVPASELRVVAMYAPQAALGRIRAGQPARMRLDGFPALQYGLLDARVLRLSSEAVGGQVRVELALQPSAELAPHLEHGLTGSVEIEVERVPPYVLVLRAAGRWLEAPPAARP